MKTPQTNPVMKGIGIKIMGIQTAMQLDDLLKTLLDLREKYGSVPVFKSANIPFKVTSFRENEEKCTNAFPVKKAICDFKNGVVIIQ